MFYEKHLFICLNERDKGKRACGGPLAHDACDYLKKAVKQENKERGDMPPIRVSQSGCLGRCEEGPVLVVYPEGKWYHYESLKEIEQIATHELKPPESA